MKWELDQMGKKSPFTYVFYADPTDLFKQKPLEFYEAIRETLRQNLPFHNVAVYLKDELLTVGDVRQALRDAVRVQSMLDDNPVDPDDISKCSCFVVWTYYRDQPAIKYETVFRRAEANVLNALGVKEPVS